MTNIKARPILLLILLLSTSLAKCTDLWIQIAPKTTLCVVFWWNWTRENISMLPINSVDTQRWRCLLLLCPYLLARTHIKCRIPLIWLYFCFSTSFSTSRTLDIVNYDAKYTCMCSFVVSHKTWLCLGPVEDLRCRCNSWSTKYIGCNNVVCLLWQPFDKIGWVEKQVLASF